MVIDVIAGARPNFMKVAALFAVAEEFPRLSLRLVHTGQHYDTAMSEVFLRTLKLPTPACQMEIGSGTQAIQTAEIMKGYERWVQDDRPDMCLVAGDVNSTVACAIVAAKEGIPAGHIEAGLRSFDRTMPEEINRILTDSISDTMFASEPSGVANLAREGRPLDAIYLVGNTMIDTLLHMKPEAERLNFAMFLGVQPGEYAYLTLHRPANVDSNEALGAICEQILWLARRMTVLFPVHPRTRKRMDVTGWTERLNNTPTLRLMQPLGYLESLSLLMSAKVVVTDSGGLQEESSALGVPCLTMRDNTERPITISEGSNTLIHGDITLFRSCIQQIEAGIHQRVYGTIPYWDGKAGRRILQVCEERYAA